MKMEIMESGSPEEKPKKEFISPKVVPEKLKKEMIKNTAMNELRMMADKLGSPISRFRMDYRDLEKIEAGAAKVVAGWSLLDEEVKKLALASFPELAIALLKEKL